MCAAYKDVSQAVDLEVIKLKTNVPSETTLTQGKFQANLLEHDICCVWTGANPDHGAGLHITPHKRGSDVRSTILCWEDIRSSPFPFATSGKPEVA